MKFISKFKYKLKQSELSYISIILICMLAIFLSQHVYAQDVLADTQGPAIDTLKGSGRNWMYIIEGITAAGLFIMTRKWSVLFGVGVIAIFLDVIVKMAGG